MRNKLKKLIEGFEAGIEILFISIAMIAASPFIALIWICSLIYCFYIYCKHPDLYFMECLRYQFTDTNPYSYECRDRFNSFYFAKRPFDRAEYDRVNTIVKEDR